MKIFLFAAVLAGVSLIGASLGAPFLHDYQPANNSYIGGGARAFSINITEASLDTNSARVHIISLNAYQQGESWDTHAMSCTGSGAEWNCTVSISFVIAGSDTAELFYFTANDSSGSAGSNGTSSNPLRFTLDRNPPTISFSSPTNNSYVKGNSTVIANAADGSSGVDSGKVQFSLDQSQWTNMSNSTPQTFQGTWNTTSLANNQTVTLYVRAYDMMGNIGTNNINVTVDNEVPKITILSSLSGKQMGGVPLQIVANDSFSGIASVSYSAGSLTGTLGCTGGAYNSTCSAVLNTASLSDGNYTLYFTATDNAGNSNTSSIPLETYNTKPSISISQPAKNAFLKGTLSIKAALANTADVKYVNISFSPQAIPAQNMTCDSGFTECTYNLDTTTLSDGGYTIKVAVANTLNLDVSASISITVDNTKPSITNIKPDSDIKGDFYIDAEISDANMNQNSAKFKLDTVVGNLTCAPQTPSKYMCSTAYDSRKIPDGKYKLNVTAEDKAGNLASAEKQVIILNQGRYFNNSGSGGAGSGSGGSSSSEDVANNQSSEGSNANTRGIIPFKEEYVMIAVIAGAVITVIIILLLVAVHRLGKPIITE